jgi:hypothetical protein
MWWKLYRSDPSDVEDPLRGADPRTLLATGKLVKQNNRLHDQIPSARGPLSDEDQREMRDLWWNRGRYGDRLDVVCRCHGAKTVLSFDLLEDSPYLVMATGNRPTLVTDLINQELNKKGIRDDEVMSCCLIRDGQKV